MKRYDRLSNEYMEKRKEKRISFADVDLTSIPILGLFIKSKKEEIEIVPMLYNQTGYMLTGDARERSLKQANLDFGKKGTCDCCGAELLPYENDYLCKKCNVYEKGIVEKWKDEKKNNEKVMKDKIWFMP